MRAGRLRSDISFLRRLDAKDAYGQSSTVYTKFAQRRCSVFSVAIGEDEERQGNTSFVTQKFGCRYDNTTKSITYADRLRFNGLDFEIIAIENVGNRNREIIFTGAHNARLS